MSQGLLDHVTQSFNFSDEETEALRSLPKVSDRVGDSRPGYYFPKQCAFGVTAGLPRSEARSSGGMWG